MATQPTAELPVDADEELAREEKEVVMVPVYDIEGEMYQQFRKPSGEDWEMSLIWQRHTVSSKAKDWGTIKARQSRPIPALYQRGRNFESVPSFKQYNKEEIKSVVSRVQRPTKSAILRSSQGRSYRCQSATEEERKTNSENLFDYERQQNAIQRLMTPTKSQAHRVELTLKYRPMKSKSVDDAAEQTDSKGTSNGSEKLESPDSVGKTKHTENSKDSE